MSIICHGCSFTRYKWDCWPKFVSWFKNTDVKNFGYSASGNETIARGVVNSVLKHKNIEHMYIMWSGSDRYEVVRDTEEKIVTNWQHIRDLIQTSIGVYGLVDTQILKNIRNIKNTS